MRNGRWYNPRFWKDLQRAVVELSPDQKLLASASIGNGANLRQASPSPDVLEEAVDQARQRLLTEADLATEWEALKTREQVESLHSDKRGLRRSSRTAVWEPAQKLRENERPHLYDAYRSRELSSAGFLNVNYRFIELEVPGGGVQ